MIMILEDGRMSRR